MNYYPRMKKSLSLITISIIALIAFGCSVPRVPRNSFATTRIYGPDGRASSREDRRVTEAKVTVLPSGTIKIGDHHIDQEILPETLKKAGIKAGDIILVEAHPETDISKIKEVIHSLYQFGYRNAKVISSPKISGEEVPRYR